MGQIAFACNRRNNAASQRSHDSRTWSERPIDNISQLDRRTELLHGTFGYANIQNGDIAGAYNL
ncbi:BQ5605_C006g03825 [Microbotryum silenes-dioicae]|uniref:BQ5605_C006g03825 protein n=1 Tax=Microbotryum silenes-dioicae TaxID=796604 RepID=A0A2X0M887_9BASI|nr:BQ5605_C006g03825 [Microbotryum silenes-dioicae]